MDNESRKEYLETALKNIDYALEEHHRECNYGLDFCKLKVIKASLVVHLKEYYA